jgi:hypothetical protein
MKNLVIGLLVGLIVGLWFGVNVGRDKPVWSNPFEEASLGQKAKGVYEDTKRAIEKGMEN